MDGQKPQPQTLQPGDTILVQVTTMKVGKDGRIYVTLGNNELFVNTATVILKKEVK